MIALRRQIFVSRDLIFEYLQALIRLAIARFFGGQANPPAMLQSNLIVCCGLISGAISGSESVHSGCRALFGKFRAFG